MRKSSSGLGAAGPRESVVALAATEGAKVETVVLVEGGTLGGCVGSSNVPVDAERLIIGGGKAKTGAAFCPNGLTVRKFDEGCGGFEVEENVVPPLCADKADGTGGRLATACWKGLGGSL